MGRSVRKRTQQKSKTDKVKSATKTAKGAASGQTAQAKNRRSATKNEKRRTAKQIEKTVTEFRTVVNISSEQLERWLNTAESQKLHYADEPKTPSDKNGMSILSLLKKRRDKYTDADIDQMETVVQFIAKRLEKRPKGDIVASNWRYSLMNWGHDPTKRSRRTVK